MCNCDECEAIRQTESRKFIIIISAMFAIALLALVAIDRAYSNDGDGNQTTEQR